jgi:hypothetical protein
METTEMVETEMAVFHKWSDDNPQHVHCKAWLQSRIEAKIPTRWEDLRDWDAANGKTILTWDHEKGWALNLAAECRRYLGRFGTTMANGMRVKALWNIQGAVNETTGEVYPRAYYGTPQISETPPLRLKVINNILRAIQTILARQKFWQLTDAERKAILAKVTPMILGE